jgi:predicted phosphodiesterase
VVRRLLLHFFGRLAPLADHVLMMTVPGNHDEARRDRITPAGDSWAIDCVAQVEDAMQIDPDRFGHVTFVYPEPDDVTVTIDVDGLVIGALHGHTIGSPDKMGTWLAGQALGRQAAGEADLLVSGHFHTLRLQDLGGGRTWLQCPSIDGGSAHFRARKGTDSIPGFVSLELTPGIGRGWRGLIHHGL